MKNKPSIFSYISASVRFVLFWLWAVLNLPVMLVNPGGRLGVWQFGMFMRVGGIICGLHYRIKGRVASARPLLMVGNHISVVEFSVIPGALMANFFGKAEIAKMPLVGIFARKAGVQFIDRNPAKAIEMTRKIKEFTERATWPMVIFPEGLSSNGSKVYPFKSALFTMMEPQLIGDKNAAQFTIQPFAMFFRDKRGNKLSDICLAQHYAYFDPKKTPVIMDGKEIQVKERSAFGQLFHIMALGGMIVDIHLLPPPPLAGIHDRKQLAEMLYKIVNSEYMKYK
ncbi:MAG: 1-acyl-sn-glycerol-3-phosphate acyltransferase [Alphaproteobacteria bacterium]|nr:1-acyl-sn-glycerol-3-phosphate acyltransferase [Alphaproteobacteria bacterium]